MRIRNRRQLEAYLAKLIHGRTLPRKPPQRETPRGPLRNPEYLAYIRTLPCAVCHATENIEAAHTGSDGGMSLKSSDSTCVPLCADCHRTGPHAYHGVNTSARDFERRHNLDLRALAARLWAEWRAGRAA